MKRYKDWRFWALLPVVLALYLGFKAAGQMPTLLLLRLLLLTVFYIASLTDLREKRIPNFLVIILALAWLLILAPLMLYNPEAAITIGMSGLIGLIIASVVLLVVYFVSMRGLGGGDVKLMSVSGLYLGYDGALSAILYGSILLAVSGLILIAAKKMTAKDAIPMAPFLYAGILIVEFIR